MPGDPIDQLAETRKQNGEEIKLRPQVVRLADVEPEAVRWLWEPYVPRRKLTFLEGDPGLGKTWLALVIAAAVSRGYSLPGPDGTPASGERRDPADVIYLSGEDGLADTLRPRLDAVGADPARVFALTGYVDVDEPDELYAVTLGDRGILRQVLAEHKTALLVVDPLQAFLGSKVDMHRANETRPILTGLAQLAEEFDCAVVLIRHLSKSGADRAIYRGLGSIDFTAAARSALLVGQDPNDESRRVIVQVKSSLAVTGASLAFTLTNGRFEWAGRSDVTAEQMLGPTREPEERSALEEAIDLLRSELAEGERPVKEVKGAAGAADIAAKTLRRAREELNVRSYFKAKPGGKRGDGDWFWRLPDRVDQDEDEEQDPLRVHVGQDGQDDRNGVTKAFDRLDHAKTVGQDDQARAGTGFGPYRPSCPSLSVGETDRVERDGQDDHTPFRAVIERQTLRPCAACGCVVLNRRRGSEGPEGDWGCDACRPLAGADVMRIRAPEREVKAG